MKAPYLLLLFLLSSSLSISQTLSGTVSDEYGNPLWGATVQSLESGVTCDSLGRYSIVLDNRKIHQIKVSYVGLKTIDTLIEINEDFKVINWKLQKGESQLEEIIISTDVDNIFKSFSAHIVDFAIKDDFFFLLVDNYKDKLLVKANLEGKVLRSIKLKEKYYKVRQSCLGGIMLIGEQKCLEVQIVQGSILKLNPFDESLYKNIIDPCIHKQGELIVFEHVSVHNKRIVYYKYDDQKKQVPIYTVFDKVGAKVSNSYFREIIGAYYQEVVTAGEEDIDYGIERDNILKEGTWSGALIDLVLTNNTHGLVGQYLALAAKKARSNIIAVGKQSFILDWVNYSYHQIDPNTSKIITSDSLRKFASPALYADFEGQSILIDKDQFIYSISTDKNTLTFEKLESDLERRFIIQKSIFYNNSLYRLGRSP